MMAFPKKKWLKQKTVKEADVPKVVEKLKKDSSQKERSKWVKKCTDIWSKLVRHRDKHKCSWCGKEANDQAHHIVPRSACSTMGSLDLRNGMTLCYKCHIHRLKADPDAYVLMRDSWLRVRGLTYSYLQTICTAKGKTSLGDLKLMHKTLNDQLLKILVIKEDETEKEESE